MSKIKIQNELINIKQFLEKPINKHKIKPENFVLPKPRDYVNINKYNYNISQLKLINKNYKIKSYILKYDVKKYKKVYRKNEWRNIIFNYLKQRYYSDKIKSVYKKHLTNRYMKLLLKDNIKNIINDCDFFTLEKIKDIPHYQLISYKDTNGFTYGFDILSLFQLIKHSKNNKYMNPYNREIIPLHVIERLKNKIRVAKLMNYPVNYNIIDSLNEMDKDKKLAQKALSIFSYIDDSGYYTNSDWFMKLNKTQLVEYIKQLYDIWIFRLQLTDEMKMNICTLNNGNPFFNIVNINSLIEKSEYNLKNIILEVIKNMTQYSINNDYRYNGCTYCLMALTLVSSEASLALPILYNSAYF
jgi:hypothetical protein